MAEKKINGVTFKVGPMAASDAIILYTDIMRVVSHSAGRIPAILIALTTDDQALKDMADVAALAAMSDILTRTSSPEILDLVKRIVETAQIQQASGAYTQVEFDREFSGKLGDILPVVKFVLMEQFADFFTGSAGNGIFSLFREALHPAK